MNMSNDLIGKINQLLSSYSRDFEDALTQKDRVKLTSLCLSIRTELEKLI